MARATTSVTGTSAANTFIGGPGADTLEGRDGNDVLEGGDGTDKLDARQRRRHRCAAATRRRTPSTAARAMTASTWTPPTSSLRTASVPAPARAPAPAAATLDRVPSTVRLTRKGYVRIRVTCPLTAVNGCTGSISIEVLARGRERSLRSAASQTATGKTFTLKAGQTKVTKVKISRNGRRRVLKKKRAKCKVSVHTSNAGTKRVTVSKKITVKAPKQGEEAQRS